MWSIMWNEIFSEMNLLYVENEGIFNKIKKWLHRGLLIMFWSPVVLVIYLFNKRPGEQSFL